MVLIKVQFQGKIVNLGDLDSMEGILKEFISRFPETKYYKISFQFEKQPIETFLQLVQYKNQCGKKAIKIQAIKGVLLCSQSSCVNIVPEESDPIDIPLQAETKIQVSDIVNQKSESREKQTPEVEVKMEDQEASFKEQIVTQDFKKKNQKHQDSTTSLASLPKPKVQGKITCILCEGTSSCQLCKNTGYLTEKSPLVQLVNKLIEKQLAERNGQIPKKPAIQKSQLQAEPELSLHVNCIGPSLYKQFEVGKEIYGNFQFTNNGKVDWPSNVFIIDLENSQHICFPGLKAGQKLELDLGPYKSEKIGRMDKKFCFSREAKGKKVFGTIFGFSVSIIQKVLRVIPKEVFFNKIKSMAKDANKIKRTQDIIAELAKMGIDHESKIDDEVILDIIKSL